ncbi:MAG: patatin-like phospholipase family protein [Rhodovibrionaceae bacterium]|nr:patatin-like phospholipase family protein [Rhodovibrionaceae bacterium]
MPEARVKGGLTGLVMPGGGARGAYQVGVLKAIAELQPHDENPFPVIVGSSVGAINGASLACHAREFKAGVDHLVGLWRELRASDVYRTDVGYFCACGMHWAMALLFGGLGVANPRSLLSNAPLEKLLARQLDLPKIDEAIEHEALRALAVSVSSYTSARAVTYFQGAAEIEEWQRARRDGMRENIDIAHLMASSALPFVFPATRLKSEYLFDGSLRLNAPLSPAIRLGADRILVIGVRHEERDQPEEHPAYPSIGQIGGYLLDILFMDNLNADIERLERVNATLSLMSEEQRQKTDLKPVGIHVLRPSRDIRLMAKEHAGGLPVTIRGLLRGIGAWNSGGRLPSYLMFVPGFCSDLIELGYQDAMAQREELAVFLGFTAKADAGAKPREAAN